LRQATKRSGSDLGRPGRSDGSPGKISFQKNWLWKSNKLETAANKAAMPALKEVQAVSIWGKSLVSAVFRVDESDVRKSRCRALSASDSAGR
jgi:hypothetical protein